MGNPGRRASCHPARQDRPVLASIGCTIRVTDQGVVTVHRDHGCTPNDVRELCDALVRDELKIIDLTQPAAESE